MTVANILRGKKVHPDVSLTVTCGSKQVLNKLSKDGYLTDIIESGARLLECVCGPCIGMGQSPASDSISLRTFNRNFYGRSGTISANIYLSSNEVAAVSALTGHFTNPINYNYDKVNMPEMDIDDSMLLTDFDSNAEIIYGPNIKPLPINSELSDSICKKVMIKVEDNITTDHIMPAGSKVLPYRSNIEKISTFCYSQIDENFPTRCLENNGGFIIARENYGQGSSREHAALAPMYLGIKAVIAKSYARIHRQNLINAGIIPFVFKDEGYDDIELLDELEITNVKSLNKEISVINKTKNKEFIVTNDLSDKEKEIIRKGGLLNCMK